MWRQVNRSTGVVLAQKYHRSSHKTCRAGATDVRLPVHLSNYQRLWPIHLHTYKVASSLQHLLEGKLPQANVPRWNMFVTCHNSPQGTVIVSNHKLAAILRLVVLTPQFQPHPVAVYGQTKYMIEWLRWCGSMNVFLITIHVYTDTRKINVNGDLRFNKFEHDSFPTQRVAIPDHISVNFIFKHSHC